MVLVVSAVQEHAVREHEQHGQQKQEYLQTLLPAVHEVTVEHVRILRWRQAVLKLQSLLTFTFTTLLYY